nr:hypothetical protein [Tanacetum cinerariifolium]
AAAEVVVVPAVGVGGGEAVGLLWRWRWGVRDGRQVAAAVGDGAAVVWQRGCGGSVVFWWRQWATVVAAAYKVVVHGDFFGGGFCISGYEEAFWVSRKNLAGNNFAGKISGSGDGRSLREGDDDDDVVSVVVVGVL